MDRKKFFQGVRNFSKFKHSRVSELSVDDELICFLFTPESPQAEGINVSIDLHNSPNETKVYLGEKEMTFEKKYIPEIVNTIIKKLETDATAVNKVSPAASPALRAVSPNVPYDPLFDVPPSVTTSTTSPPPSSGFHSSEFLESGEVVFSEPFAMESGIQMVDSRGHKFRANEELKNDIEAFQSVYGRQAITINAFEEEIIILLDLGVDTVIGKDMMMAWGFDNTQKIYARVKTSVYYRDGAYQKIAVQQGAKTDESFAPQFQLESILNNFGSHTWSHESPPFTNPVTTATYISPRPNTKTSEKVVEKKRWPWQRAKEEKPEPEKKPVVSKNLRQLVGMGFNIGKATKALMMSNDDLSTAIALCCENLESIDVSDLDQEVLNKQLSLILNGDADGDGNDSKDSSSAKAPLSSYLVDIVQYMQSRIPTMNEYCIICDMKHLLGHMLKPTVCTRELCCWSFQELGVAAGATDFVATSYEVVDMLLSFAQDAIRSSRRNIIFDPYPLIFDPADRKKKVFDPERKDYSQVERILTRIPSMKTIVTEGRKLGDELSKIDPYANALLNWVISSNRSFFVKLPDKLEISCLKCEQFLMLSSPPDKEKVFRSLRKQYGSVYAFHGSPRENWHSIVRNGLKNASGTSLQINGTAYGRGIYMSPYLSTASGYTRGSGSVVIAVCEVINRDIKKSTQSKTNDIWVVPNESYVTTRMLLIFHGSTSSSYSATGEKIAQDIRNVMKEYGVSQD